MSRKETLDVSKEVGLYAINIDLASLTVDPEIIYCGVKKNVHQYKYVMKILELNVDTIVEQHKLEAVEVKHPTSSIRIVANDEEQIWNALNTMAIMLRKPVAVFPLEPDELLLMCILKGEKQPFSHTTRCWLHFKWKSKVVTVYGINGMAAIQWIERSRAKLRECIRYGSVGLMMIEEKQYSRQYQSKLRKAAAQVEVSSGCKLAVQAVHHGTIAVQFYGTKTEIRNAQAMIDKQLLLSMDSEQVAHGYSEVTRDDRCTDQTTNSMLRYNDDVTLDSQSGLRWENQKRNDGRQQQERAQEHEACIGHPPSGRRQRLTSVISSTQPSSLESKEEVLEDLYQRITTSGVDTSWLLWILTRIYQCEVDLGRLIEKLEDLR